MSTKRSAEEENGGSAEKKAKEEGPVEGAYLALPIVPSIVSHDAENHMKWVVANIPTAEQLGETFKDDKGLVMHGVVAITNKHAKQHVYFGDAGCAMGGNAENDKSTLAKNELCKGLQLHLNLNDAASAKLAWTKATEDGKATVLLPFEAAPWGAMFGLLRDPFGFVWAFCSDLPPKEEESKDAA